MFPTTFYIMKNLWQKLNKPILALAPMAGFTDSAFREICKKHGADMVYSEMASASGLFYNPKKTLELLKFNKPERPCVVQLFGSNPEHFSKATKIINEKISARGGSAFGGKPDGIDINFGCPVKKVMKTGAGCALINNPKLAREIIKAVCDNTDLPVSIKIRVAYKNVGALDFIKKIKDLPFQAVMVHARTYEQGFSGQPDYSMAEKIKKIIPDKIVLANGGINSAEDAIKILKDYPTIDGLGIARGALGHPWIFEEIKSQLSPSLFGRGIKGEGKYDFKKILLSHAKLTYKNKGSQGLKEFRAHIGWYIKGFPGALEMRKKLIQAKNLEEIREIL
jgi:tRNA-dihydrouridine synthase B